MTRNENGKRSMADMYPNTTLRPESSFLLQHPQPFSSYISNVADGDAQDTTKFAGVDAAEDRGALVASTMSSTMSAAAIKGRLNDAMSSSASTTQTMSTVDDARDEEEESVNETSVSYSDDSASLSDAYFFPQSDEEHLACPPRYRKDSILTVPKASHTQHPLANYYGSMNSKNSNDPRRASFSSHSQTSPLWVASIKEHSEVKISLPQNYYHHQNHPNQTKSIILSGSGASNGKNRAKNRRECRRQRQKKREAIMQRIIRQQRYNNKRNHYDPNLSQRELAVVSVRGRLQTPTHTQNLFWALLFLLQLLAVMLCAMRSIYGLWCAQTAPGLCHFWQINGLWTSTLSSAGAAAGSTAAALRYITTTSLQELEDHADDMYSSFPGNTSDAIAPANFEFTIDYQNVIALLGVTGFYACIVSILTFGIMLVLARSLIQIILIFSVSLALALGMLGLTLDPYGIISMMGFTALLLTLGYSLYNWGRIPFAAQNLYTSMSAMSCTADVTILGLGCLVVAFTWCIVWGMAFIGIVNSLNNIECESNTTCGPHVKNRHIPLYVLLIGSFLWTSSVIKNITGVAVANVVGIWWYSPKSIGRICTPVLRGAVWQAVTTSLGSICFGSLLVPPARVLLGLLYCLCWVIGNDPQGPRAVSESFMSESARIPPGDDTEIVSPADPVACLCHHMCVWRDQLFLRLRSCNQLSFTYMGMYGYGLIEAGERAIQLFETRDWMDVVNDVLIQNVLFMACLIVGASTGTFAVVVEDTDGYYFTSFHKPILSAFLIGAVMGYVLSNILLLGLVGSAVNTVFVCFAADPFEFDKQHPRLSRDMREVWSREVWEPHEPNQQPA